MKNDHQNEGSIHLQMYRSRVLRRYNHCAQQVKRELKRIHVSGYRCNPRLKAKTDGSNRLVYTGLRGDLEHLTIGTRLIHESFECVMGECVI